MCRKKKSYNKLEQRQDDNTGGMPRDYYFSTRIIYLAISTTENLRFIVKNKEHVYSIVLWIHQMLLKEHI